MPDDSSFRPKAVVAQFFRWWRDELQGLLPAFRPRHTKGADPDLTLIEVDDGYEVGGRASEHSERRSPTGKEAILRLTELARQKRVEYVGIRLRAGHCYSRRMEIPAAARANARRILNLDLERITPFRLRDVYTTYLEEDEIAGGRLRVRQLVAKREVVDPLVADVRAAGLKISHVDCWENSPSQGLPVDFLEPDVSAAVTRSGAAVTLPRALAAFAFVLSVGLAFQWVARHEAALVDVRAETARMRERAQSVRQVFDSAGAAVNAFNQLQHAKLARTPTLEILDEVSRLLPDSVWLSEFRLEEEHLDISGLARSGAALPQLFAGSRIFADATLTAPLTLDSREDKERFSLRARLKQPVVWKEASPRTTRQ